MTDKTAQTQSPRVDAGATAEFERLYRANVDAVTAYFARRTTNPQVVADLVADTFVAVITGFGSFDPRKGTARAWVFGIARRVYASYCESYRQQQNKLQRLAGRRDLVSGLATLPERDRAVIELVDLAGLRPKEAAAALGLRPGTVRMRLMRARTRLRQEAQSAPHQDQIHSLTEGQEQE